MTFMENFNIHLYWQNYNWWKLPLREKDCNCAEGVKKGTVPKVSSLLITQAVFSDKAVITQTKLIGQSLFLWSESGTVESL